MKQVEALTDEEIAIGSGLPLARVQAIYGQDTWEDVTVKEMRAFCRGCLFDLASSADRNRMQAYLNSSKRGRGLRFLYLKRSPLWHSQFKPMMRRFGAR